MSEFSPEQLEQLTEIMGKLTGTSHELNSAFMDTASSLSGVRFDALQKASKQASEESKNTARGINLLGQASDQATDAFFSAAKGTGKYSNSLDSASDGLTSFAANMTGVGKAAVIAGAALLKVAANSLKQNDVLIGAYRTLSEFGNIDASGTQGVMDMMHTMGATTKNVEYFLETMRDIAPIMTAFGGSVSQGSKKFAQFQQEITGSDLEVKFKQLGLSTEDIAKYGGKFVTDQTKYGLAQGRSTRELTGSFYELMKVSADLADLTGQSRDAQQKQLEENQRDARWRLHLMSLRPEEAKAQERMLMAAQSISKGHGDLLKDQLASGGAVTTQQTAMLRNQLGDVGGILKKAYTKAASDGTDTTVAMLRAMKGTAGTMENFRKHFVSSGFTPPAEILDSLQLTAETSADGYQKLMGLSAEEMKKRDRRLFDSDDKRLTYDVIQEKSERQSQIMADKFTYTIGNLAVPAITGLAWITNKANQGLAELLKIVSLGTLDYTDHFKSLDTVEDAEQELTKSKEKEKKLLDDKLKIETKLNEINQKIAHEQAAGTSPTNKTYKNLLAMQKSLQDQIQGKSSEVSQTEQQQQRAKSAYGQNVGNVSTSTVSSGSLSGLKLKEGDVTTDDKKIDPKLIGIAKQIQDSIPGFHHFSSFNDAFHKDRNSAHNQGKALDFSLDHWPSEDEGREIVKSIKALGAGSVIDEYNHPSPGATGGHIHAQLGARTGGVFKGPQSGYQVELHGHEAVLPMSKFNNFYNKMDEKEQKSVTNSPLSSLNTSFNSSTSSDELVRTLSGFMDLMSDKFDDMIAQQRKVLDVNEQLLTYTKH